MLRKSSNLTVPPPPALSVPSCSAVGSGIKGSQAALSLGLKAVWGLEAFIPARGACLRRPYSFPAQRKRVPPGTSLAPQCSWLRGRGRSCQLPPEKGVTWPGREGCSGAAWMVALLAPGVRRRDCRSQQGGPSSSNFPVTASMNPKGNSTGGRGVSVVVSKMPVSDPESSPALPPAP